MRSGSERTCPSNCSSGIGVADPTATKAAQQIIEAICCGDGRRTTGEIFELCTGNF